MPIKLTKFDVAERQLFLAIRLFFREEDPISIHTLSEAASQVLYDIGSSLGAKSILRDTDFIRNEKMREWHQLLFKSRNFFKHADRDRNDTHNFDEILNHFSLIDASNMHKFIKKNWTPETYMFNIWFSFTHEDLLVNGSEYSKKISELKALHSTPSTDEKSLYEDVINLARKNGKLLPQTSLLLGLPE